MFVQPYESSANCLINREDSTVSHRLAYVTLIFCHMGDLDKTSIVAALLEVGGGLVNTLLPVGEAVEGFQ